MKVKRNLFLGGGALIITIVVLMQVLMSQKSGAPAYNDNATAADLPLQGTQEQPAKQVIGRYTTYTEEALKDSSYTTTLIFFHAPWCIECRGFEMAINEGTIPDGVQILKVDYDSNKDLRQKYGVTIQSTFVRVDGEGTKQKLWTGYGKEKSVDTILENTK